MTKEEGKAFTSQWLPAWTGNQPEKLVEFYTEDAFYLDPVVPGGIRGRAALLAYFQKLLAKNPNWVWTNIEVMFPTESGFLNKWRAAIPVGGQVIECVGVCTVELRDNRISRNEVYFDRSRLLSAMRIKPTETAV
jgi:hypothetical protein